MKFSFDWSNAINPERRDIVFEHRNKEYGGYALRRDYQRRVIFALLLTLSGIGLTITAPLLISFLSKAKFGKEVKVTEGITLEEPPPIDKSTPPPPPVIPPPPVQQTIKFTPPKVVKDEEVEEPPPGPPRARDVVYRIQVVVLQGAHDAADRLEMSLLDLYVRVLFRVCLVPQALANNLELTRLHELERNRVSLRNSAFGKLLDQLVDNLGVELKARLRGRLDDGLTSA